MPKYTTVEGHEIVRDGEYETRDGKRVKFIYLKLDSPYQFFFCLEWTKYSDGGYYEGSWYMAKDLMRPWKSKPDAEGWIEWDRDKAPNLPIYTEVELRFNNRLGGDQGCVTEPWIWQNITAYRIVKEPSPDKKVYKLSEMWKVWYVDPNKGTGGVIRGLRFFTKKDAYSHLEIYTDSLQHVQFLAIIPADATEFYEGEGLEK